MDLTRNVSPREAQALVASVPAWHQRYEIAPGVVTPGSYEPGILLKRMGLPDDLSGRRVLDLGASDGFFSLMARRRGAQVVAIDYRPKDLHGFAVMEQISGLDFEYHQMNIYEISRKAFGTFEIVLFSGVLYHLPDMLKALSLIHSVCDGQMFLETHCANDLTPDIPAARYYPASTLNQDRTNFWSPNALCLRGMLHDAAFDIEHDETWGDRYFARCRVNQAPGRTEKLDLAYGLVPYPS
jgi:tRNA (mo5U34)-methyltransferase